MPSVWNVHPPNPLRAQTLALAAGIHPVTAQLLMNRGIRDRSEAVQFLHPSLQSLGKPAGLPDLPRGVARLRRAIDRQEPILIFSDSDVDGLTASVILYETLQGLGAIVRARQSNRITDGYGLPPAAVQQLAHSATKLLILVDCGTNQPDSVHRLATQGIETIIVDHHVPLGHCAKPYALINPHCESASPHHGSSSAALAFHVAQALAHGELDERLTAHLDLAALGTLADCSPLLGDNRVIVAEGLARIIRSARLGLRRLCEATRTCEPEPEQILRRLVPRLNACGRLGDPSAGWNLLLREAGERVDEWLTATEAAHETTKRLHRQIMAEAQEQVNRLHFRDQFVMVVSGTRWHQGLMGPLASQLAQRYGRPSIALAMDDRRGTGSGRSIPLFNLLEALQACQELLVRFGGHAQACGLIVDRKHLERFRVVVNEQARRALGPQDLMRTRRIDVELSLRAVEPRWVHETERFAPFGQGNPRPTVLIGHLTIETRSPRVAVLCDGRRRVSATGRALTGFSDGPYDVVASPSLVNGELVLAVSDVRASTAAWEPVRT